LNVEDKINVRELIIPLHIISLCGGQLNGKTRFQKLVFLSQEDSNKFNFEFKPAQFGPLSYKLNHALERMKKLGLLEEHIEQTQSGNKVINYSLTEDGQELVQFGLTKFLDSGIIQSNKNIVNEYANMSYVDLLDYVHIKYPQYLA